jgi:hypothetical protein
MQKLEVRLQKYETKSVTTGDTEAHRGIRNFTLRV